MVRAGELSRRCGHSRAVRAGSDVPVHINGEPA